MGAGLKFIEANWKAVKAFKIEIEQISGKGKTNIPCKFACPTGIDVPGYIALIKVGRKKDAYNLIRKENPFPAVCGRICVRLCESKCVRGEIDQPISIMNLKRYVADWSLFHEEDLDNGAPFPANGKKIGIVGAGPAGLTCGYFLARSGYSVEIYETHSVAGGILAFGIPEYRLPQKILQQEITLIERAGVKIHLNVEVGKDIELEELKLRYDAVYVAVGSQVSKKIGIQGEELSGVSYGLDFLRDVHLSIKTNIEKNIIVVGGGNVAFDAARVALRLGAQQVRIVCLESRENMLANPEEIQEGEEEGIIIHPSRTVARIIENQGRAAGIECLEVESCYFDEENMPHIEVRAGSEHVLPADAVIIAIGQRPANLNSFKLALGHDNTIHVDRATFASSSEGIFAGGDAIRGSESVIVAIADGKAAAIAIDTYLGGNGILNKGEDIAIPEPEKLEEIVEQLRFPTECLQAEARTHLFDEIHKGFENLNAISESARCLRCDR